MAVRSEKDDTTPVKTNREDARRRERTSTASNVVSALVALLFVGVAGYFVYTYFADTLGLSWSEIVSVDENETTDIGRNGTPQRGITEDDFDTEDRSDDIIANSDVRDGEQPRGATGTGGTMTQTGESVFGQWIANDYKEGEIKKGSYTVKAGDTLWELAEGAYGSGYEWTTILQQNSANVGYLPNGQQALIMPGQVLNI